MNILEFIEQGGKVITAGGCDVIITDIDLSRHYCLIGTVQPKLYCSYSLSWDKDGFPERLPTTHGQNLLAVVPEIKYNVVPVKRLREANSVDEL